MACMSCVSVIKKKKNFIKIAPHVPVDLKMKSTTKYADNTYHNRKRRDLANAKFYLSA